MAHVDALPASDHLDHLDPRRPLRIVEDIGRIARC
jgi:hypothetical protein